MACDCTDRQAIIDVLNRYSTCLDTRDWPALDAVFHPDAVGDYGGFVSEGRSAIVTSIGSFLDGCGPSQHLLGNYQIDIDGDEATTATKVRVVHVGAGDRCDVTYESIGTYYDRLVRTADGWRIVRRHFDVQINLGDISILQPA